MEIKKRQSGSNTANRFTRGIARACVKDYRGAGVLRFEGHIARSRGRDQGCGGGPERGIDDGISFAVAKLRTSPLVGVGVDVWAWGVANMVGSFVQPIARNECALTITTARNHRSDIFSPGTVSLSKGSLSLQRRDLASEAPTFSKGNIVRNLPHHYSR